MKHQTHRAVANRAAVAAVPSNFGQWPACMRRRYMAQEKKESNNGQANQEEIQGHQSRTGRPDLLRGLDNRLREPLREINEECSKRGLGEPGSKAPEEGLLPMNDAKRPTRSLAANHRWNLQKFLARPDTQRKPELSLLAFDSTSDLIPKKPYRDWYPL